MCYLVVYAVSLLLVSVSVVAFPGNVDTNILSASDLTSMGPFYACTYESPNYAMPVNGRLKTYFDESAYDGTRLRRGVEICTTNTVYKELWQGFSLWVPSDIYPYGKQSIIAQQFCQGDCVSWCSTLAIENNTLVAEHRGNCSPTGHPVVNIVDNIARDTWHAIIINARFSNSGQGHYIVYYDGQQVYNASAIDLGFDSAWTDDDFLTTGVGFKNGQYNANTAYYNNGTRVLYFDNVTWYTTDSGQTDGYQVVDPTVLYT